MTKVKVVDGSSLRGCCAMSITPPGLETRLVQLINRGLTDGRKGKWVEEGAVRKAGGPNRAYERRCSRKVV